MEQNPMESKRVNEPVKAEAMAYAEVESRRKISDLKENGLDDDASLELLESLANISSDLAGKEYDNIRNLLKKAIMDGVAVANTVALMPGPFKEMYETIKNVIGDNKKVHLNIEKSSDGSFDQVVIRYLR